MSYHSDLMIDEMEQAQEAEEELYLSILDALSAAKELGLSEDHLSVLRYVAGINLEDMEG